MKAKLEVEGNFLGDKFLAKKEIEIGFVPPKGMLICFDESDLCLTVAFCICTLPSEILFINCESSGYDRANFETLGFELKP